MALSDLENRPARSSSGAMTPPTAPSSAARPGAARATTRSAAGAFDPTRVVVGITSPPRPLASRDIEDRVTLNILAQVAEGLVRFRDDGFAAEPGLASRWSADPSGRRWTFELREGVRFSDGVPLTPVAVVESFGRGRNFGGRVEACSPTAVRFELEHPNRRFPEFLAQSYYLVSRVDGTANGYLGTGPWRLESVSRGATEVVLAPNPAWRGPRGAVTTLVFRHLPFVTLLPRALAEGSIDLTDEVAPSVAHLLRDSLDVRVDHRPGLNCGFLAFNTEREPWREASVRRIAAAALDRARLVERHFPSSSGTMASTLLPAGLLGGAKPAAIGDGAPPAAATLPAEVRRRLSGPLRILPLWASRPYLPDPAGVAAEIATQLRAAGFPAEAEAVPTAEVYFDRRRRGDYDLILAGWIADDPNPASFLHDTLMRDGESSWNVARFADPRIASLVRATGAATGSEAIAQALEVERILAREVPLVPLFSGSLSLARRSGVEGAVLHPCFPLRLWDLEKRPESRPAAAQQERP